MSALDTLARYNIEPSDKAVQQHLSNYQGNRFANKSRFAAVGEWEEELQGQGSPQKQKKEENNVKPNRQIEASRASRQDSFNDGNVLSISNSQPNKPKDPKPLTTYQLRKQQQQQSEQQQQAEETKQQNAADRAAERRHKIANLRTTNWAANQAVGAKQHEEPLPPQKAEKAQLRKEQLSKQNQSHWAISDSGVRGLKESKHRHEKKHNINHRAGEGGSAAGPYLPPEMQSPESAKRAAARKQQLYHFRKSHWAISDTGDGSEEAMKKLAELKDTGQLNTHQSQSAQQALIDDEGGRGLPTAPPTLKGEHGAGIGSQVKHISTIQDERFHKDLKNHWKISGILPGDKQEPPTKPRRQKKVVVFAPKHTETNWGHNRATPELKKIQLKHQGNAFARLLVDQWGHGEDDNNPEPQHPQKRVFFTDYSPTKVDFDPEHLAFLKEQAATNATATAANKHNWEIKVQVVRDHGHIIGLDDAPPPTYKEIQRELHRNARRGMMQKSANNIIGKKKIKINNKHFHTKASELRKQDIAIKKEQNILPGVGGAKYPPKYPQTAWSPSVRGRGKNESENFEKGSQSARNSYKNPERRAALNRIIHHHHDAGEKCQCHTKGIYRDYTKSTGVHGFWYNDP